MGSPRRRDDSQPARTSGPRPLLVAVLLPLGVLVALVVGLDLPVARGGSVRARPGRAAIALRDHVQPVEKLGTWALVEPRLERAYGEVRTVTQHGRGLDDDSAERFRDALGELLRTHDVVDVFLLAHTNGYVWDASELDVEGGELGLVYNSGCRCAGQAGTWLELGADAYVAHPSAASHAPFLVHFLDAWLRGELLSAAVARSNARTDAFYRTLGALLPGEEERWLRSRAEIHGAEGLALAGETP